MEWMFIKQKIWSQIAYETFLLYLPIFAKLDLIFFRENNWSSGFPPDILAA